MVARIVNQGEIIALEYLVNKDSPENLVLRLFKNDVESGLSAAQKEALDETDFTQADFTGYGALTLTGASWVSTPGDPGNVSYAEQVFASTANQTAQTIYGWYLTRLTGGELVMYDYLNNPQVIQNDGDQIRVTPTLTAQDTID